MSVGRLLFHSGYQIQFTGRARASATSVQVPPSALQLLQVDLRPNVVLYVVTNYEAGIYHVKDMIATTCGPFFSFYSWQINRIVTPFTMDLQVVFINAVFRCVARRVLRARQIHFRFTQLLDSIFTILHMGRR